MPTLRTVFVQVYRRGKMQMADVIPHFTTVRQQSPRDGPLELIFRKMAVQLWMVCCVCFDSIE
jgi:hypothetical protein